MKITPVVISNYQSSQENRLSDKNDSDTTERRPQETLLAY